ncbi:protein kinase activating protein dpb11 [Teratosphaeriaceae sp. CCFEE 6253]|nr:protein kinase activating protein dpb11 [Teratosphaeriaceae sp. CCFEE 6253]
MAHREDQESDEQLPLKGVVLCCTSLPADIRLKLAEYATQMGAVHQLDLTTYVTHLIVGNVMTPKYRYVAKERPDVKIVSPRWLEAARELWMAGEDVDIASLEDEHRLGVFSGLHICVTGFDDMSRRTYISDTVVQQGATYHGDLIKTVTHLVAAAPAGAKYDAAVSWQTRIVSYKWFEDSLRRGMALDESLYDPAKRVEDQGKGAFIEKQSLGKRSREKESQGTEARKLRRTASTRLHSQSQDMWQDLSTTASVTAPSERGQWGDEREPKHLPQQRPSLEKVQVRQSNVFSSETASAPAGLFSGCHVLIRGFPRDRAIRLQAFLEPQGAIIAHTATELEASSQQPRFRARYLLMPHASDNSPMPLPTVPADTKLVTEWWVERCIHSKTLIEPLDDPLCRPLWDAKIPDFAGLSLCTTGFSGTDFRQTAEAIKLMGAQYAEKLVPSVDVLVSGSAAVKKEKAYYAAKHKIRVVSVEWLWECLSRREKVGTEDFAVKLPSFDATEMAGEPSPSSPAPSEMLRGKSERYARRPDDRPKRLSNTRHRSATPTLALQASAPAVVDISRKSRLSVHQDEAQSPTAADDLAATHSDMAEPKSRTRQIGPFVLEDDDDPPILADEVSLSAAPDINLRPTMSQPLQEVSPNASPRKGSQSLEKAGKSAVVKVTETFAPSPPGSDALRTSPSPRSTHHDEVAQPPAQLRQDFSADIAALLHHRTSSRSDAVGSEPAPVKRKNRPLGRSASGIGNHRPVSGSAQSDHAGSSDETHSGDAADGFTTFAREARAPPSTQLGYETAEATEAKAMMEREMKVSLRDEGDGKRVASVGVVRDSFGVGGGGGGGGGGKGKAGVGERARRHRTRT